MAASNDSVLITPGSGATIATHNPGDSKEYQVIMQADHAGQLIGSKPCYLMRIPPQVAAANKIFFDLFNASGSLKTVEINGIWPIIKTDVAVTGVVSIELLIARTNSVGTGGTLVSTSTVTGTAGITAKDVASPALPAQITARLVPTGGAALHALMLSTYLFPEETSVAALLKQHYNLLPGDKPIVLPVGYGIRAYQGTVASVNNYGFIVDFSAF